MLTVKKNLYKQPDIFKCVHDVHLHFKAQMSPYHILIEKKCYPHGCIYFHWKCKLLAKQPKCFRNFTKVGRECFNCRYFYEEKIHQYPEFLIQPADSAGFLQNFEDFDEWVQQLKNKRVLCEGTISEVKPDFILKKHDQHYQLILRGYLVAFPQGYIDNQFFEDRFYLSISAITQKKLMLRTGDTLEFEAGLILDRGRFKFIKSGRFQFQQRGSADSLQQADPLTQRTFTIHPEQPAQCLNCRHGTLVDIETSDPGPKRTVICLQGIPEYKDCPIYTLQSLHEYMDRCANTTWNDFKCQHLL
jgi:hypothetical protein